MINCCPYNKDLATIVKQFSNSLVAKLHTKTFLITGANGLLGSTLIDLLLFLRNEFNCQTTIYAIVRNEAYFRQRFPIQDDLHVLNADFIVPVDFCGPCDFIVHAGANTHPALFSQNPADTLTGIFLGTKNLLDVAVRCHAKMLLVSSGEAYGFADAPFTEYMRSVLDPTDPRSCYPLGKAAAENLCASYKKQFGIDYNVIRPCHLYGPCFTPNDTHVCADFINRAAMQQPIIMKSAGLQKRSLCHALDCASAILTVLLTGENGACYNVSVRQSTPSIFEFAKFCAEMGKTDFQSVAPTQEELAGYSKIQNAILCPDKLYQLGWIPAFDWQTGIAHSIQVRKGILNNLQGK